MALAAPRKGPSTPYIVRKEITVRPSSAAAMHDRLSRHEMVTAATNTLFIVDLLPGIAGPGSGRVGRGRRAGLPGTRRGGSAPAGSARLQPVRGRHGERDDLP